VETFFDRADSLYNIIAIIGGAILGPLGCGIGILAASEALYARFIKPETNWLANVSKWVYCIVAWIIGALSLLFVFLLRCLWEKL
jgi:hypothetical protein